MPADKMVKDLSKQLRNVGPKLASKLVEAGIDTPEKLKQTGAKEAFKKIYPGGDSYGDFNAAYLYALEGAIRNCDWLDIPEKLKQEYKEFAQNLQKKKRSEG
ncbi:MAG: TfoX/Sxy family DNA transformation protein [Desulfobacterales bacterium]|nr:TfoX/Sxy family DNA transformation protein [Desulfobacterales bacterium]